VSTHSTNNSERQLQLRSIQLQQITAQAPEEEQTHFGFLEEISLSPKKRDRHATASFPQLKSVAKTKIE
jgi:hypothetical protein